MEGNLPNGLASVDSAVLSPWSLPAVHLVHSCPSFRAPLRINSSRPFISSRFLPTACSPCRSLGPACTVLATLVQYLLCKSGTVHVQLYPSPYIRVWNLTDAKAMKRITRWVEEVKNQSLWNHLAQSLVSPPMSWDDNNFNAGIRNIKKAPTTTKPKLF